MTLFPTLTQAAILSRQSVTVDEVDRLLFAYDLPGRKDFRDDVIKITTNATSFPRRAGGANGVIRPTASCSMFTKSRLDERGERRRG